MIVTCEACSTSLQLDEARIPAGGARVRCSRCKHAFFLPHPSTSAQQAVHAIAEDAAADVAPGTPSASADLAGAASAPEPTTAGLDGEPEEEDWQFNEEVRVAGDEAERDHDFDVDADFGEGFDEAGLSADVAMDGLEASGLADPSMGLGEEPSPDVASGLELDVNDTAASDEVPRDESSFGSVEDFSSWMEDDETDALAEAGGAAAELAESADSGIGVHVSGGSADDLGDPESWDLIGSESDAPVRSLLGGAAGSVGSDRGRPDLAISDEFLAGFEDSVYDEPEAAPSVLARGLGAVGSLVGWALTLGLIAGVSYALLRPEWTRWSEVAQTVSAGSLVAETTDTGWIETTRSGSLLVVRGRVRNEGRASVWPRPVRMELLDAEGARLGGSAIGGGEPLLERVLREAGPVALEAARRASIESYLASPLLPGEVRPFEIVIGELPTEARRILLELGEPVPPPPAAPTARPAEEGVDEEVTPSSAVEPGIGPTGDTAQVEESLGFSP